MRKSIKGALEVSSISHTNALLDVFDVAHFISPDDDIRIHHVLENNKPLIVSALYSENDKNAAYLNYNLKLNGDVKYSIKQKSLRLLNNANVVLVPSLSARDALVNLGVTSEIRVMQAGVNLMRFNFLREDEKEIFNKYYRRNSEKKMVIGFGDRVHNINSFATFVKIAKACPDVDFYYISVTVDEHKLRTSGYFYGIKCPKNCITMNLMSDDMYRSALMNASLVIFPGNNPPGAVSIYDAMASKSQIIIRSTQPYYPIDNIYEYAIVCDKDEELVSQTKKFLAGEIQPTVDKAYELISLHGLDRYGKDLITLYNEQISLKNN